MTVVLATAAVLLYFYPCQTDSARKPHIVLIVADDLVTIINLDSSGRSSSYSLGPEVRIFFARAGTMLDSTGRTRSRPRTSTRWPGTGSSSTTTMSTPSAPQAGVRSLLANILYIQVAFLFTFFCSFSYLCLCPGRVGPQRKQLCKLGICPVHVSVAVMYRLLYCFIMRQDVFTGG